MGGTSEAHRQAMVDSRSDHRGYTESKPRPAKLPPVPACERCKRPSSQPHQHWCPTVTGEAVPEAPTSEPPPPLVVRYTTPTLAAEDWQPDRRMNVLNMPTPKNRKEKRMPTALPTKTYPLSVLDALADPPAAPTQNAPREAAQSLCQKCGPQSRSLFSDRKDGTAYSICRTCKAETMRAHRYDAKGTTPAIPQDVAEVAYAAMTEPPVIEQHQVDAVAGRLPDPIDDDIAKLEARLGDLHEVRSLMACDLPGLLRKRQLLEEAIIRKQAQEVR